VAAVDTECANPPVCGVHHTYNSLAKGWVYAPSGAFWKMAIKMLNMEYQR